jgi:hypothetical protein
MFKKFLLTTALTLPLAFAGIATAQTPKKSNMVVIRGMISAG